MWQLLVACLAIPLAVSLVFIAAPQLERDSRLDADVAITRWLTTHRSTPADELLPLCANASFFAQANQLPPYPYLWVDHVRSARDAIPELRTLLGGSHAPKFVALYQPVRECDTTGTVAKTLRDAYEPIATVSGIPILRHRDVTVG